MPIRRRLTSLIQNLLFKTRVEQDLDDEMRACLDILTQQKVQQGQSPEQARRSARIELGGVEQVKESVRDVRIGVAIESVLKDVRYGLRQLARSPLFAAVAGITLALGIGATAAIFSVVDAVILQPLAVPHADRVVQVREDYPSDVRRSSVANYLDFTDTDLFERITPLATWSFLLGDLDGADHMREVAALEASHDFLPLVGVEPILGRGFLPDERFNWVNEPSSTILTYDLWQQHFEGSADALGKTFTLTLPGFLDTFELTVVGILPRDFRPPPLEMHTGILPYGNRDLLLPPRMAGEFLWEQGAWSSDMSARSTEAYYVLGRLNPDVSVEQAQARLGAVAAAIAETYPDTNAGLQVVVTPLPELLRQYYGTTLYLLWAAAGVVLMIACVNVASLLLGRGVTRRHEFAVRFALGAGRGRLFRQLIAEGLLLGVLGGATGLILASWGTRALVALVPVEVYRLDQAGVNPRVLAFVAGTSLLTALLFGLLPAFSGTRLGRVACMTKGTGGSTGRLRSLNGLVVAELALALVLIAGAGLLLRTYQHLNDVELGFDRENLMTVQVELAPGRPRSRRGRARLYSLIREHLSRVPGVVSVGGGFPPLMPGYGWLRDVTLADRPLPSPEHRLVIEFPRVPADYFEALGAQLISGRTFTDADDAHRLDWTDPPGGCESPWCVVEHTALRASWTKPVVINDVMARRFWPGESALGKVIYAGHFENPERAQEESYTWDEKYDPPVRHVVVGIVREIKRTGLAGGPRPQVYEVWSDAVQQPILVRTSVDPRDRADVVRGAIESLDADVRVTQIELMDERFGRAVAEERFRMFLMGVFAVLAVVLAAIGLFGLMAYAVRERTREIGIRISFGAQRADILRLVGRRGFSLIILGVAIGLGGAFGVTRFMSNLLFGVTPLDPMSFAGAVLLLGTVGLIACYIPARRATRVDPIDVLRTE